MTVERNDYDVFLDTWEPGALLKYATLPSNLNDPVARQRLLDDSSGEAHLTRAAYARGAKFIDDPERALRGYEFIEAHHAHWAAHFRDRLESTGVDADKVDAFIRSFPTHWVDGRRRRQHSPEMIGIKAAIRIHDRAYHAQHTGQFCFELSWRKCRSNLHARGNGSDFRG